MTIDEIQELIAKYRNLESQSRKAENDPKDVNSLPFHLGQQYAMGLIIADLRELVLNEARCGV